MTSLRRSARISTSVSLTPEPSIQPKATQERQKRKASTSATYVPKDVPKDDLRDADIKLEEAPRPSTPPPKKRRGRPPAEAAESVVKAEVLESETVVEPVTPPKSIPFHPSTPTPKTPKTPRPRHPAVNRLANADVSNAVLISPETSRIVSAMGIDSLGAGSKEPKTSILDDACAHLVRVDPRMQTLIDAHYCTPFGPDSLAEKVDPFESLASGIISQQVSGAAARAIKGRFVALFGEGDKRFPSPSQVAAASLESLRSAGLSQRKAEYLQGLGAQFVSGALSTQLLADAPYDELVERLVAVRGLGQWSVEMFALFGLKRLDVFSVGDLGVQRGMAAYAGRDIAKLRASPKKGKWKYMTGDEMEAMAEPFRPYRSVFMWYMWQVESVDVSTMG